MTLLSNPRITGSESSVPGLLADRPADLYSLLRNTRKTGAARSVPGLLAARQAALFALLSFVAAVPLIAALPQPVKTQAGLVAGVASSDGAIAAFKGIPFAAAPAGDLRWRAPKPAAAWQGVRKADEFGDSCVQRIVAERKPWTHEFMAHNKIGEDCLHLNVWTGAVAATERRPVFVWIYGGGYTEGSTAVPVYDGENLAKRGIVVVTVNYRLGVLGFLAHPDLTKESDRNASGNYGMLDQIAALEWVQQNIAAFGGDPKRVTIGGQSAGASSVHNLVASPLAKGLFQRAIAESGSSVAPNVRAPTLKDVEAQGVKFAESKGAHNIEALRAMKWEDVVAPAPNGPAFGFRPVVDGWALPASPGETFAAGKQNDVPTLTGLTADEGSSQAGYGAVPAEKWIGQVRSRFGDFAGELLKLYPAESDASQKALARELGMSSMHLWAANRAKTAKSKVFTYYWTHAEPGPDSAQFGAFHTSEVPYVFNTLDKSDRGWTAEDRKIAQTIGSYWINFMTSGDPNGKGLAQWPAFNQKSAITMELGDQFKARPVADKAKVELFGRYLLRPADAAR